MRTVTVFEQKDIEAIIDRALEKAVPAILKAIGAKDEQPAPQPGRWMTIDEVRAEIGGKTSRSYVHRHRKEKDFPYEYKEFSAGKTMYRLKNGGGNDGNTADSGTDTGLPEEAGV